MNNDNVLIFDFDGTIADTFHYLMTIGNRLSGEFGFKRIEADEVEGFKNKNIRETLQHLDIPFLKIPMIVSKAKKELHKEIDSVKPVEGLKEILLQLKGLGFRMGILSSNSMKNVMSFLKNNDLDCFDFIHATPKIWSKNRSLKVLLTENSLKLSQAIYIGDETRDILAARKAGMRCAAVTWGYNSKKILKAHHPDYLIQRPEELFQIIK